MGVALAAMFFVTYASLSEAAKFQSCVGILVEEDASSLLLKPDGNNKSLWCDAYIGEDKDSAIARKVLAVCRVGTKCAIKGHFEGHGVFYWTSITSVVRGSSTN